MGKLKYLIIIIIIKNKNSYNTQHFTLLDSEIYSGTGTKSKRVGGGVREWRKAGK